MSLALESLLASGAGTVTVITGCMYAGKSEMLMRQLKCAGRAGIPRCLIRPKMDDRGEPDGVVLKTHAGEQLKQEEGLTFIQVENLVDAVRLVPKECKIIAIDEGQFLLDVNKGCEALARNGAAVYVATLNGDYRQKCWPHVADLLAASEHHQKLSTWCMICKRREAHFTKKLTPTLPSKAGAFEVGGQGTYAAVCRGCL